MFYIFIQCDHCDAVNQNYETQSLMAQYSDDSANSATKVQLGKQNTGCDADTHEVLQPDYKTFMKSNHRKTIP